MITSVYIHIPFCEHICHYCDFCKQFYNEEVASKYLDSLKEEIMNNYRGDKIKTLYIGGGTPSSLSIVNLKKLMSIIKYFKFDKDYEFTIEVNPENIDSEKILLLKDSGINRVSIGVESTIDKHLNYLGRKHDFNLVKEKIELLKKAGIKNINVDLIYAIPNETITDLKKDLDNLINLNVTHISTYSLEIHDNTILKLRKEKNIDEDLDREMYDFLCQYLKEHNYNHYEISNFSKNNYESQHNLVYWHNEMYYGFGLGASGYIDNIRYTNTKSMQEYLNNHKKIYNEKLSDNDIISYALILGFRLVNGINKNNFEKKYQRKITDLYNISDLINKKVLVDDGEYIRINDENLYIENIILENFV